MVWLNKEEFNIRIGKAATAFGKFKSNIQKTRQISRVIIFQLYKSNSRLMLIILNMWQKHGRPEKRRAESRCNEEGFQKKGANIGSVTKR